MAASPGGELLRQPHRHARTPGSTSAWTGDRQRARARCARCRARSRSPTRSSPTSATRRSSPATAGRRSPRRGARRAAAAVGQHEHEEPAYRDVLYVEELIGPDTVNTVPPATFDAFRDHGRPAPSLEEDVDGARHSPDARRARHLARRGHRQLTARRRGALRRGLREAARGDRRPAAPTAAPGQHARPAPPIETPRQATRSRTGATRQGPPPVGSATHALDRGGRGRTGSAGSGRRGAAPPHRAARPHRRDGRARPGFEHALLLGMGGSSLCPEVLELTFGRAPASRSLRPRLDRPGAGARARARVDLARTLFIVSSKSGTTLEPNIFKQYFFERVQDAVGADEAGAASSRSPIPARSSSRSPRATASATSSSACRVDRRALLGALDFGMVPGAVMGLDVRARCSTEASAWRTPARPAVPPRTTPGSCWARSWRVRAPGRDKLTLVASPGIADLGAWLEQLLAESTGQGRQGRDPGRREPLGAPDVYGDDRVFVYLRLGSSEPRRRPGRGGRGARGGRAPVVRIAVDDLYDLGGEFFRWEFATAVAGAVIGINPFDQPDVEASKIETRELTAEYEKTGAARRDADLRGRRAQALRRRAQRRELRAAARQTRRSRDLKRTSGRIGRRLRCAAGLRRDDDGHEQALHRDPQASAIARGGHLRRLRPALPALDRAGLQGRPEHRACSCRSPATTPGPAGAGPQVHLRRREGRAGARRLPGPGRARPRALRVHLGADVDAGLATIRRRHRAGAAGHGQGEGGTSCSSE